MSGPRKGSGRARRAVRGRAFVRRAVPRPLRTTILLVGEGRETEPNYFRGLRREDSVAEQFSVTVRKGCGQSPESVVAKALEYKQRATSRGEDYDEVWCVLDVEGADKRASLDRAEAAARQNGLTLCLSNPCFEVWFLAHFERKARPYGDCRAVIKQLNTHWRNHHGRKYEKNDDRIYERLRNLTRTAITNARSVREDHHQGCASTADCNSSTEVYRLVGRMVTG